MTTLKKKLAARLDLGAELVEMDKKYNPEAFDETQIKHHNMRQISSRAGLGEIVEVDPLLADAMGAFRENAVDPQHAINSLHDAAPHMPEVDTGASGSKAPSPPPEGEDLRSIMTDDLIAGARRKAAPWQHRLKGGEIGQLPFNPVRRERYKALNCLWLMHVAAAKNYTDPRWMTQDDATTRGAQIIFGQEGTRIEFWTWAESVPKIDENGIQQYDAAGNALYVENRLSHPTLTYPVVFNAQQITGLMPFNPRPPREDALVRCGKIAKPIRRYHGNTRHPYYDEKDDSIHLPDQQKCGGDYRYYATVLHHAAHATAPAHRLARIEEPSYHPMREELCARVSSMIIAGETGIGNDIIDRSLQSAALFDHFKDDPASLAVISRDAERAATWILRPKMRAQIRQAVERRQAARQVQATWKNTDGKNRRRPEQPSSDAAADKGAGKVAAKGTHYIHVPFEDNDAVKRLGGKFDAKCSCWYVPSGAAPDRFSRWKQVHPQLYDPVRALGDFIRNHGIDLQGDPQLETTTFVRLPVKDAKNQRDLSGTYKAWHGRDGKLFALVRNFKIHGEPIKWQADYKNGPDIPAKEAREKAAEQRNRRANEIEGIRNAAAKKAQAIWNEAAPANQSNNDYLSTKKVLAYDVKLSRDGALIVPCRQLKPDGTHEIRTLQFIRKDSKSFLRGGAVGGCMHRLGNLATFDHAKTIFVAEGYATAATIHQATMQPVAIAFNAGNLREVAENLNAIYPKSTIIITADDDHRTPGNPGITKAIEAAAAVGGHVIGVTLTDQQKSRGATDFNDLSNMYPNGIKVVKSQIRTGLKQIERAEQLHPKTQARRSSRIMQMEMG